MQLMFEEMEREMEKESNMFVTYVHPEQLRTQWDEEITDPRLRWSKYLTVFRLIHSHLVTVTYIFEY